VKLYDEDVHAALGRATGARANAAGSVEAIQMALYARGIKVSHGPIRQALYRLEAAGHAERVVCPLDKRRQLWLQKVSA
jgi:hypothetical protein